MERKGIFGDRKRLLAKFDDARRIVDASPALAAWDDAVRESLSLLTSSRVVQALDVSKEPESLRERYGQDDPKILPSSDMGYQAIVSKFLLARRLVEAGVWLDDWKLEELGLVNVLRREACPFVVRSEDGRTVYEEGKDFEPVADPKLGRTSSPGSYRFDHAPAALTITVNSRIKNGDKLKVSWYHPVVIHEYQVAASLSDPKVFELLKDQAKRVNALLKPKTWFMSHDEIRVTGWCRDAETSGKTPGQRLAENARRCVEILHTESPGSRIAVWSDMFDPNHNAVDKYYLVNGPLTGSWEGLPK